MCVPLINNEVHIQNQVLPNEEIKKNVSRENAQFTAASDEKDQENNCRKQQFHVNCYYFKVHINWTFFSSIIT